MIGGISGAGQEMDVARKQHKHYELHWLYMLRTIHTQSSEQLTVTDTQLFISLSGLCGLYFLTLL
jgi:hypothetical protein